MSKRIAILIPCLNEAATIGDVVKGFRETLPDAEVYVYDNGSTDETRRLAREAGAIVRREPVRGKGAVVQRMKKIEVDYVVDTWQFQESPECLTVTSSRRQTDAEHPGSSE